MVRSLNKFFILCVFFAFASVLHAQPATGGHTATDYKDRASHEKFNKRSHIVAAWQINQLKTGALVVRLKKNQAGINQLRKAGNEGLADQKEVEQYLINKYIVRSYLDKYRFGKVYFIYSSSSDSLLHGTRSGIFLDSTLNADPSITMNEKFYLIAERDYVYNSSLGFVREDSVMHVNESGNPTREMAIVIKNKYGHQLKAPFPYYVQDRTYTKASVPVPIKVTYKGTQYPVEIPKQMTYDKFSQYVETLSDNLREFLISSPDPSGNPLFEETRPYLY